MSEAEPVTALEQARAEAARWRTAAELAGRDADRMAATADRLRVLVQVVAEGGCAGCQWSDAPLGPDPCIHDRARAVLRAAPTEED